MYSVAKVFLQRTGQGHGRVCPRKAPTGSCSISELAACELYALVRCEFPKYEAAWCPHGPVLGPWGQVSKDGLLLKGQAPEPLEQSKSVGSNWISAKRAPATLLHTWPDSQSSPKEQIIIQYHSLKWCGELWSPLIFVVFGLSTCFSIFFLWQIISSFGNLFIRKMWSGKAFNLCAPPLPFPVRAVHMTETSHSYSVYIHIHHLYSDWSRGWLVAQAGPIKVLPQNSVPFERANSLCWNWCV